jgi:hypothetical protein
VCCKIYQKYTIKGAVDETMSLDLFNYKSGSARIVLTCLRCEEMYKRINGLTVRFQFSCVPTWAAAQAATHEKYLGTMFIIKSDLKHYGALIAAE